MKKSIVLMGIGASLMYFLDPEMGEVRRGMLRDKFEGLMPETKDALASKADEVAAKVSEITEKADHKAAETIHTLGSDTAPDTGHS